MAPIPVAPTVEDLVQLAARAAPGPPPSPAAAAEKARQSQYRDYAFIWYWYFLAAVFGLLAIRHILHGIAYALRPGFISPSVTAGHSPSTDFSWKPRRVPLALATMEAGITKLMQKPVWWFLGWTRMQLLGVLIIVGWNMASLLIDVFPSGYMDGPSGSRLKFLSYRAGAISTTNMLLAFLLIGRNNIVTMLTGIPYESLRFMHKTIGSCTFFFGMFHGITFLINTSIYGGGAKAVKASLESETVYTGIIALAGLFMLTAFSLPIVRRWFYELFLITHVLGYAMFIAGVWYHRPERRHWVYACIALVSFERVARIVRKIWNAGFSHPIMNARAEVVSGALLLKVPYPGHWQAGSHAYLKFYDSQFKKKPWLFAQSHPFSIANVPYTGAGSHPGAMGGLERNGSKASKATNESGEKIYADDLPILPMVASHEEGFRQYRQEMFFLIRIKNGLTKDLMQLVKQKTKSRQDWAANLSVSLEGPYGGGDLQTGCYETIVLFAGGSGVTHILSVLLDLVQKARSNMLGHTLAVEFIWTIQDSSHLAWITEYLNYAFATPVPNLRVRCSVYVTRTVSTPPASLGAAFVPGVRDVLNIMKGRPDVFELLREATEISQGSILTLACGPKQLSENVQDASASLSSPSSVAAGSRQRYIRCEVAQFE